MFGMKQGEDVRLSLVSANASGGVAFVVIDSNGLDRPIKSTERLVIDSLLADIAASVTVNVTDPGAAVSTDATVLASFSPTGTLDVACGEGINLSIGSTPVATASATGAIVITGTGRIINGKSQGGRPNFKELLTAGGNVGGT